VKGSCGRRSVLLPLPLSFVLDFSLLILDKFVSLLYSMLNFSFPSKIQLTKRH